MTTSNEAEYAELIPAYLDKVAELSVPVGVATRARWLRRVLEP